MIMRIDIENEIISYNENERVSFNDIITEINPFKDDVVYLAGSLIEGIVGKYSNGMGNSYSDIDVFIIREHDKFLYTEAVYDDVVKKTYFPRNLKNRLDVEVYDSDYVIRLSQILKSFTPSANERSWNILKNRLPAGNDLSFVVTYLNRFLNSICVHNNRQYEILREQTDFHKFFILKRDNLLVQADNAYPDVIGNLEVQQYDVALYCMREVYMYIVWAVLAHEGISFDRNKWLPLKFQNFVRETGKYTMLWSVYVNLFRSDLSDNIQCAINIKHAIEICKKTTEDLLLGDLIL